MESGILLIDIPVWHFSITIPVEKNLISDNKWGIKGWSVSTDTDGTDTGIAPFVCELLVYPVEEEETSMGCPNPSKFNLKEREEINIILILKLIKWRLTSKEPFKLWFLF